MSVKQATPSAIPSKSWLGIQISHRIGASGFSDHILLTNLTMVSLILFSFFLGYIKKYVPRLTMFVLHFETIGRNNPECLMTSRRYHSEGLYWWVKDEAYPTRRIVGNPTLNPSSQLPISKWCSDRVSTIAISVAPSPTRNINCS